MSISPRRPFPTNNMFFVWTDEVLYQALSFLLVAVLWGATNPFIKRGSAGIEAIERSNKLLQFLAEMKYLFFNWHHLVPFLINQTGSILYYLTIGQADISLAVPITNSLTFLVTMVTSKLLGEKIHSNLTYVGIVLVVSGVALCVTSKIT